MLISNCFNSQKTSYQVGNKAEHRNSKIVVITNKYKNTLDDLIDNLNTMSSNWARPIDKKSCNASKSKNNLTSLLESNCLNEYIPNKSL